jgi:ubiquinone/menaquinone biosynthesis C-methylase UbiE
MNEIKFNTWEEAVSWLISQSDKEELVQACYYDSPLKSAANRYWQSEEWKIIQKYLPSNTGYALDIGAGRGISSYALAKDGWQVTALEPDPSQLVGAGAIQRLANEEQLSINIVQEFGENLPFEDASFDFVFARQVLHHAQDLSQLCREIYRVLKPGGIFIAVRDHVIATKADLPKFLDSHPLHYLYGGENAYLRSEYLGAIRSANFKIEQILDTYATLKQEVANRLNSLPMLRGVASIFLNNAIFPYTLKILSKLDRRPGRAISFICYKN